MIERIRIRGLGVIEDAEIELGPGLVAITGETGAGKTMVLTGLGLLAGKKADAGAIRRGADRAEVDGEWLIGDPALVRALEALGAELDPLDVEGATLVVGRALAAGGRSRATVGGRPVASGVLEDVAAVLVAIHGQADQQRLRQSVEQREILDRFGGATIAKALAAYDGAFQQWRAARRELDDLRGRRASLEREAAALAAGVADIDSVAPEPQEDVRLDAEARVLANSGALLDDVETARAALADDDGSSSILATALRSLERAAAVDPGLGALADQLRQASGALGDVAVELAAYADGLDADPARQAWVEQRRSDLAGLRRRYGATIDEVLSWREEARSTLDLAQGADGREAELEAEVESGRAATVNAARALTKARRAAAAELASRVTEELQALAMVDAEVSIDVVAEEHPEGFTASGADEIAFLLRPHAGSDPRPLAKGASGGELSRIMLAIEVALAGADPVPTFVFDEVDAGIGGRAAVEVGRRLARLSRTSQVIVVTHLPQVAAFADIHVVVAKGSDGSVTATSVSRVSGDSRVAELVRMLSGLEASEAGAEHARELLQAAAAEREPAAPGAGRA